MCYQLSMLSVRRRVDSQVFWEAEVICGFLTAWGMELALLTTWFVW